MIRFDPTTKVSGLKLAVLILAISVKPAWASDDFPEPEMVWSADFHDEVIQGVAVNSRGYVATASRDSVSLRLNPDGERRTFGYFDHDHRVTDVAMTEQGEVFTIGHGYLYKWEEDHHRGSPMQFQLDLPGLNGAISLGGNGNLYVTTSADSLYQITPQGDIEQVTHVENPNDVAASKDGYAFVATSFDGIQKIDPDGNREQFFDDNTSPLHSVAVTDGGNVYAGEGYENIVDDDEIGHVYKIDAEGNYVWSYTEHFAGVSDLAVDEQGYLYTAGIGSSAHKIDPDGHRIWKYGDENTSPSRLDVGESGHVHFGLGSKVHKVAQPPEPPQPKAPGFDENNMNPGETLLNWSEGVAAQKYSIQVAHDQLFGNPIGKVTDLRENEFELIDLEAGQTYYWRVKAHNELGTSSWSEGYRFTTEHPELEAPELISPEDETTEVAKSPLLSWHTVADADNYELVISETEDFSSTVTLGKSRDYDRKQFNISGEQQTTSGSDYHIAQRVEDLDPETEYFWRVRAMSGDTPGEWSSAHSFETRVADSGAPELASPLDQEEDVSIPVALEWADLKDAENYEIQVSPTAEFDSTLKVTKDMTSAEIGEFVADTTTYYWRTRAVRDGEATGWSEAWRFVTELRPPETPEWNPEDGETDVEELILKWDEAARAEMYNLQLAANEGFDELIIEEDQLTATKFEPDEGLLDPSKTYYWRVQAVNEAGNSEWSEPLSFSTSETVSAADPDERPDEYRLGANYPNPFNPVTAISYQIPEESEVRLEVYNMLGQRIETLVSEQQSAGRYEVSFDASNLSSGTYIYRIEAGKFVETKQMMLVK